VGAAGNPSDSPGTTTHRPGHPADAAYQPAQKLVAVLGIRGIGDGVFQGIDFIDLALGKLVLEGIIGRRSRPLRHQVLHHVAFKLLVHGKPPLQMEQRGASS
jgi:hypothetical protein